MAHTNIGWQIFQQLQSKLQTNIKDVTVASIYRVPTDADIKPHLGKFGRAVLIKLENDELGNRSGGTSTVNRWYTYQIRAIVKYVNKEQQDIMNLSEEVKYYLQSNTVNGTYWQDLEVGNIEYIDLDEDTNMKESNLSVRILRDG